MKKIRILSTLLCIILLVGITINTAAAIDLAVRPEVTQVLVPLNIHTSEGPFAAARFAVETTGEIDFISYDRSGTDVSSAEYVITEKDGKTYIGFFSGSNDFAPKSGSLLIGILILKYSGNAPATIKVSEFKLERLNEDNQSTISETFTNAGTNDPFSITYNITRDESSQGDGSSIPPVDGSGSGGSGNNGVVTTPTIEIGEDETPLATVYAPFLSGYPDSTIRPDRSLSRAELSQIIYNLYHSGADTAATSYTDVDTAHWAYKPIAFCQREGYMLGYPDGSFKPGRSVTRAELCATFARIKNLPLSTAHPFTDVVSSWATEYIGAMYNAGYIDGYPDGMFRAGNAIIRVEAATLICKAEDRDITLFDTGKTFIDLTDPEYWGYRSLMHAANGYSVAA